jgi:hypothetical protein
MDDTPRQLRLSSRVRGVLITALIAGYGWLVGQPQGSFTEGLLIAAVLQVAVILIRRWVPPAAHPAAMHVFELIADAITVLLFALSVLGGINHMAATA